MCDFPKEICGTNATFDNTRPLAKILHDGKYYTQEEYKRAFPDKKNRQQCGQLWQPTPDMTADECKLYQDLTLWGVGRPEDQDSREMLETIRTNCCVPNPTTDENGGQTNTGRQKNIIIGALVVIILFFIMIIVALAK